MSTLSISVNEGPLEEAPSSVAPNWNGVYRVGGACLALAGLIYLLNTTLGSILGTPPADSQPYLLSLADHPSLARVIYGLYAPADFLFVPAMLALYLALRRIARNSMLLATGLMAVFVVVDLALTEATPPTLVTLSRHAATAASEAQRAAYTAAADYALVCPGNGPARDVL